MIVTINLGDFPHYALARYNIEARHPDDFVLALLENHRASLKNPRKTSDAYLAELDAQGLGKTAITLRKLVADGSSGI